MECRVAVTADGYAPLEQRQPIQRPDVAGPMGEPFRRQSPAELAPADAQNLRHFRYAERKRRQARESDVLSLVRRPAR